MIRISLYDFFDWNKYPFPLLRVFHCFLESESTLEYKNIPNTHLSKYCKTVVKVRRQKENRVLFFLKFFFSCGHSNPKKFNSSITLAQHKQNDAASIISTLIPEFFNSSELVLFRSVSFQSIVVVVASQSSFKEFNILLKKVFLVPKKLFP